MIVMPALAKTQKRHNPLVAALVSRLELTLAKAMANGIGAEGHVMHQENPHQAGPEETCPPTDQQRDAEREHHPERVSAIDKDDDRVLQEMPAVDVGIWCTVIEEPSYMRMKKALKRTVWITLTISPRVMFYVDGRPFKHRSFHRHGAQDEQNKLDDAMGPETAMREHAMD